MDIKEQAMKIIEKISKDEKLQKEFKEDPIAAIEKVSGVDIPDDMKDKVADMVKTGLKADAASGLLGGLKDLIK